MILIFTGNEQLDRDLERRIENSRVVYYPDYVLEEPEATVLITTVQNNKFNFKEFLYKVRDKNIRVILLLESPKVKELPIALTLGIYDLIFDPFTLSAVESATRVSKPFSEISEYIKPMLEIQ